MVQLNANDADNERRLPAVLVQTQTSRLSASVSMEIINNDKTKKDFASTDN